MARIILNVDVNTKNAQTKISGLKRSFEIMAQSLSNISVNKNLTAQMNSVARYYNALAKAAKQTTTETKKLNAEQTKQSSTQKKTNQGIKQGTEEIKKHSQSLKSMIPNIIKWQVAMTAVMYPLRLMQTALQSINETLVKTEDAVIALQRVLPSGSGSDKDIADRLYNLAARYGQTFDNAAQIAQNFARAGLDWNQTIKATEAALLALNVAELDATQASDGLLSIMTQFGYEASDLTEIVDKLNKTADNFPVTTEKLLTALQRTGSSAKNARMELDDTIGVITALSKATNRSGANLGTAANALIQYSTKSSALDIFSKLSEGSAQAVENYRTGKGNILDIWRQVSAVIKTASEDQQALLQQLADSPEIENLSKELHDELGDIFEQTQEVYGTANTFRKNYFIALLDNIDTVNNAIGVAQSSLGYSQKENQKYLDTYTAKVTTLKTEWQKLANDEQGLLGIKKSLIDIALWSLKVVETLGGLKTVLRTAIILTTAWVLIFKTAKVVDFFTGIVKGFQSIIHIIPNAITAWKSYAAGIVSANTAMQASIPIIGLVLVALSLVAGAVSNFVKNAESLSDKIQNLKEKVTSSTNNLSDLNSKLEENNKLLQNANKLGASDSYIKRLQAENKELERKIELEKALQAKALKELGNTTYKDLTRRGYKLPTSEKFDSGPREGLYNPLTMGGVSESLNAWLGIAEETGEVSNLVYDYFEIVKDKIDDLYLDDPKQKQLYDELQGLIDRFLALTTLSNKQAESNEEWEKSLDSVVSDYEKILDYINEIRNAQQTITDLTEKQKALEDAMNNKNVRVYNSATGMWEWQANEKDVKSAREALENAFYKNVENELKTGTKTTNDILDELKEYLPLIPSAVHNIAEGFRKAGYDIPATYDNGGILTGLGGIKATSRPETVLPPYLTEKILTPSTNAEFASFAKSMGILFGASKEVGKSEIVHNYGGNTSNSDNRVYNVNGVPISEEMAKTRTVAELFEEAALFKN